MSLAVVYSRAKVGIEAPLVHVEAHLSNGLPAFSIVGLPEAAVKESKDRVRSAILNSGFEFPASRITVNLAPADLPKEGGRFDLAIALGILAASEQIPKDRFDDYEFIGELALTGAVRGVAGVIPAALNATAAKHTLILPTINTDEASLSRGEHFTCDHLLEICAHLTKQQSLKGLNIRPITQEAYYGPDLAQVKGQHHAKRALEICAAGGHNLLL